MYKDMRIFGEQTHSLNLNNSGTLNKHSLEYTKRTMLFDLLREHVDQLVSHRQHYPQNDISDVELKVDFVIMDAEIYRKIVKLIERLPKERSNTAKKYLKFPNIRLS